MRRPSSLLGLWFGAVPEGGISAPGGDVYSDGSLHGWRLAEIRKSVSPLAGERRLAAGVGKRWSDHCVFLVFAGTALVMASVGIYAVIAQSTMRRTREIGIRMALGSTAGGIARLVLSRGMVQLGLGLGLGLVGAFATTGLLQKAGFLIAISRHDPLVLASTTVLLTSIGLFACWIPARRAARIDPMQALRAE